MNGNVAVVEDGINENVGEVNLVQVGEAINVGVEDFGQVEEEGINENDVENIVNIAEAVQENIRMENVAPETEAMNHIGTGNALPPGTWHALENYRWVPGGVIVPLDRIEHMLPECFVEQQAQELAASLTNLREILEDAQEGDRVCLCCQQYKATRQAIPCGHLICCRQCLPNLLQRRTFFVTLLSGEMSDTGVILPVVCLQCRALVGQFIRPY